MVRRDGSTALPMTIIPIDLLDRGCIHPRLTINQAGNILILHRLQRIIVVRTVDYVAGGKRSLNYKKRQLPELPFLCVV